MNYKTQSILTVGLLIMFTVTVGFFLNDPEGTLTGAVVHEECACAADIDCDDGDVSTEDICLYAEECSAAICVNKK